MKITRKEFNRIFKTYNDQGKQIWVVTGVNELDDLIVKMAINLPF